MAPSTTEIEERDVVRFCHTGRDHQVSSVKSYGYILCGVGLVVHAEEIILVRKAEPIVNEFAGMSREQIRAIITERLNLSLRQGATP